VLRFHAAAAELQAAILGLRGGQAQELHHADIPAATAGLLRYVPDTDTTIYALCVPCVPCGPYPKCTAGDGHISRVLWPNRYWERIGGIALSPADTPGILLAGHINIPLIFRQ